MKTRLTRAERLKLANAKTFEELFEVAMVAIHRLYQAIDLVSGPVSTGGKGSIKRNIAVFRRVINRLSRQGYVVFDQMPFEKHMWRIMRSPYFKGGDHLLEAFYGRILSSGLVKTVHMMQDWRSSHGATWEHRRARRYKIQIRYL